MIVLHVVPSGQVTGWEDRIGKWTLVLWRHWLELKWAIIPDFGHLGLSVLYRCLYLIYLSTDLHRSPWEFQSKH